MNNNQKSILGTIVAVWLLMLLGTALVVYSLMAAAGIVPASRREKAAVVAPAEAASSSKTEGGAAPAASSPAEGQAIFREKCGICHTIGGGILVGPDLQGVTTRQDRDWLTRWILEPDKVLAEGDPIATELFEEFNNVPMINQALTEAQVAAVLAYLDQPEGAPASQPAQAAAPPLPEGDLARGQALFTGARSLRNGAPACISCHSTTGVGVLGGGTLGPDLTNVHERYGEAGLATALKSLPFPTMQGMFADKPLTDNEVADLYTYFAQTDQSAAQPMSFNFVWIGLGGFILLGLLSHLTWNKRLAGVRIPLVGR